MQLDAQETSQLHGDSRHRCMGSFSGFIRDTGGRKADMGVSQN